ncbi:acetyl-CoA carboxylase biotin carboxyl carrier protein [Shewanella youngdeokensis]|uniref:Biotin carboxyl carrier protein of acetyl-CoA carboxylase n=1 Tax=Shewanella youngdeokensis TaxID=2999068 RepID=A0ABZ0K111_9GAMM|nr:acetyl-CoA carboxylase biotin carboxyl carrier protein [Shewanella sp. DAU334]
MDIRKIKKLIDLVQESDIAELEIKEGEESVRICRHSPVPLQAGTQTFLVPANSVGAAVAKPSSGDVNEPGEEPSNDEPQKALNIEVVSNNTVQLDDDTDTHKLLSPVVGTIHLTDKLSDKPFCSVGQKVTAGDMVCSIEAMTMMNNITADKSGTITAIFIEDGEQVDFEQPILAIE